MQTDPAFQEHVSGLIVPAAHARTRQVFTKEEWRLLDKASRIFHAKGVALIMECARPGCSKTITQVPTPGAQMVLQCACTDRVLTKAC